MAFLRRRLVHGHHVDPSEKPSNDDAEQRARELAKLEREKQLEIEEGIRRIEWIENEKSIIQREQR